MSRSDLQNDLFRSLDNNCGFPAGRIRDIFQQLLLPEPHYGEFRETSDQGYLVLLTDYGCTLRITSNLDAPPVDHHRLLKPLYRFDLLDHRFDINPGVKLNLPERSADRIYSILDRDDIHFHDCAARNCGSIPAALTGSMFDYTVVIDDGAFYKVPARSGSLKISVFETTLRAVICANDNDNSIQERAYKPLRDAFQRAIKSKSPEIMRQTWDFCRQEKQAGRLRSDWTKKFRDHPAGLQDEAGCYAERIRHTSPQLLSALTA